MALVATSSSISSHQLIRKLIHGDHNQPRPSLYDVLAGGGLSRLPCRTKAAATMSIYNGNNTSYLFRSFNISWQQTNTRRSKNMGILNSSGAGGPPPPPSGSPSSSSGWFSWILWTLVPMLIPFLRNKGGPWNTLKDKVDNMVHTVEMAAEVIEEVAEEVEKVVEDIEDKLPEGALRNAAHSIHEVADEAIEIAKVADDLAHKAEDIEAKMEDLVVKQESVVAAAKEVETDMADLQKATADAAIKDQERRDHKSQQKKE